MALKISVAIATYNEEKNIKRCLDSVRQLADEIVVVDGGSDDKTVKIASSIGRSRPEADRPMVEASGRKKPKVKVFVTDNPPIFHINKQKAIDKCNGDWILQLDADEEVTKELKEEILEKIKGNAFAGFFIPRKNFFLGRFLKKGGQYPDHTLRLYRKGKGRLPCRDVHEQAEVKGKIGYLKSDLIHWADPDFSRYLQRFNRYTDLLAKEIKNRKKKNYIFDFFQYIFIKPLHWFLSTFLRHKGFLDGWQGLIFSFFSALRFPIAYLKSFYAINNKDKNDRLKKRITQVINCILILLIFKNFLTPVILNKGKYTRSYWSAFPSYKKAYENSQYMQDLNFVKGWIPDEIVYAYAAGEYLRGTNPILIDSQEPPLGKYFLALSIAIFDNENLPILVFGTLVLVVLFLIGKEIYQNTFLALLPPLCLSFEKLFISQFVYVPLLDIIQLFFILLAVIFFIKAIKQQLTKKVFLYFAFSSIALGGIISVKFFITGIIVVLSWYLFLLFRKDLKRGILLFVSLSFSLIVLILSYLRVFFYGYSLRSVFGIQKWIFLYHSSKLTHFFTVWPLIFLNRWYVWWGDKPVLREIHWQISWPIITTIAFLVIIFYFKKGEYHPVSGVDEADTNKSPHGGVQSETENHGLLPVGIYFLKRLPRKKEIEPIMFWILCYSLFISFAQANSRYLIPLLPFLYLVSFHGMNEALKKLLKNKRK